jgi:hypothetical protein
MIIKEENCDEEYIHVEDIEYIRTDDTYSDLLEICYIVSICYNPFSKMQSVLDFHFCLKI